MADSSGTVIGSMLGTSTVTAYIERKLPRQAYDFYLCGREEMIRDVGSAMLAKLGYRVVVAADWLPASGSQLRKRRGDPYSLASIVYTSGTTGRPKGVMLSHHNMLSVAHAALTVIDVYEQDLFLSFLPLSHTLERTAGYYLPIMAGAGVA